MSDTANLGWVHGRKRRLTATSSVQVRSWEDLAERSPAEFASNLGAMGFESKEIEDATGVRGAGDSDRDAALRDYLRTHPSYQRHEAHDQVREWRHVSEYIRIPPLERLRDWIAGRHLTLVDRRSVSLKLPLFVLAAPGTKGAKVGFEASTSQGRSLDWSISVAGTGLGGEATVTTEVSIDFEANAGEAKLVFLPVTVTVEKLQTDDGRITTQVSVMDVREQAPVPGLLLLAPTARPPAGVLRQTYPVSGDTTGALATYGYRYRKTRAHSLSIGVKAFGADLSVKCATSMDASVALSFNLPGGHDYKLYAPANGDGVLWGD